MIGINILLRSLGSEYPINIEWSPIGRMARAINEVAESVFYYWEFGHWNYRRNPPDDN